MVATEYQPVVRWVAANYLMGYFQSQIALVRSKGRQPDVRMVRRQYAVYHACWSLLDFGSVCSDPDMLGEDWYTLRINIATAYRLQDYLPQIWNEMTKRTGAEPWPPEFVASHYLSLLSTLGKWSLFKQMCSDVWKTQPERKKALEVYTTMMIYMSSIIIHHYHEYIGTACITNR